MADIGTLVVKMAADSAQLRAELDKVKGQVTKTGASIDGIGKSLKVVGGLVAGAFTIGAITAFASRCIQAADALKDVSERLGVSASALQSLQLAATQSGGSVEGLNTAFGKMQQVLGDAVNGNKQAQQAFANLNLNFRELATLAPDQAFGRIANSLSGVNNQYQFASFSQDIFGKGAKDIAGLLKGGSAAVAATTAELERMGARLTDLDIDKIAMLKDEVAFSAAAFQNLGIKVLANASPAISILVESFNNVIASFGGASEAGRYFGIAMTATFKLIETIAQTTIAVIEGVRGAVTMLGSRALGVVGIFNEDAKALSQSWESAAMSAYANADRAGSAALKAGFDIFNAATIFDKEAQRMEQRATNAANAVKSTLPQGKREPTAAERRMEGVDGRQIGLDLTSMMTDNQLREAIEKTHLDNMLAITQDHLYQKQLAVTEFGLLQMQIQNAFGLQQIEFEQIKNMSIIDLAGELFTVLGGEGSKLFKVQKAFAIANTVIQTSENIVKALGLPFPANLKMAAKVAAVGAINIAKIKATNPGGSASVSSGGLSGSGGAAGNVDAARAATQGNADQSQQQQQKVSQVVINGNLFSGRETADWLIGQISEAVNDRDVVFIGSNSRQAGLIGGG